MSLRADTLLDLFLQPVAKRAEITKWVDFHTFRYTFSALLKATGEDGYKNALTPVKRDAQNREWMS
ncbi:MAG: hypothetical protein ABI380_09700 [Edaphobacter sp.]